MSIYRGVFLEEYNYNSDGEKDKYYRKHVYTDNEKNKTMLLKDKIREFDNIVYGKRHNSLSYVGGEVSYFDDIGYISVSNVDRDEVNIYYYGKDLDEAFINLIIEGVSYYRSLFETANRGELDKEYKRRFPNSTDYEKKYHGSFFVAELSLKDFRKYYGDIIPEEIINYYENYIHETKDKELVYDYITDGLIKK